MYNLTKEEMEILEKLDTPCKIQDFLNKIPVNFEKDGDTCLSPRRVLRERKCHCIEGALLAYLIFKIHGEKVFLVDLRAVEDDFDHVICVFEQNGKLGCVSKSNHAVHRYREPVYKDVRELVMSIFHEYADDYGNKTLREYSVPVVLDKFGDKWITGERNLWKIPIYLDEVEHFSILDKEQIANLRKLDEIEIKAGNLLEWEKK